MIIKIVYALFAIVGASDTRSEGVKNWLQLAGERVAIQTLKHS